MKDKGAAFLRPGTLLMFFIIAAFGFGMYNWASSNLTETRSDSLDSQSSALVCSNLEISNAGLYESDGHVDLYFETNSDVEEVNIDFQGDRTVTRTVRLVQENRIESVSANVSEFSSVSLTVPDCSRVFQFS